MSTVDDRIVRMQFDNSQFEAGVSRSMKTLDMLNEKLQFKEAAKGVSALQVAVSNLEGVSDSAVSSVIRGLDKMATYSTTIVGKIVNTIKDDIAGAVTGAIRELASIPDKAFSQIKTGGWTRATNIANAQFTIEGLGYSWEKVRSAADYAVTDTAYGLDAAAKAASQLAASGVDFEEVIERVGDKDLTQMHKALRGISGVAAMTNSSYEEIANIFTKVAGTGRLYATELNSISIRGINAAATLAKYLGVTESDVHDLVRQGLIDFEIFSNAMDDAFGDHAKEANKTFSGSLSNMKAALSRIGAIFAQPVMDKTNTFFISVTSQIKKFQKALTETGKYKIDDSGLKEIRNAAEKAADAYGYVGEARNQFIKEFVSDNVANYEESGISKFATHFAEAWEAGVNAASRIIDGLDFSWFDSVGRFLDGIAIRLRDAFNSVGMAIEGTKQELQSVADAMRETIGINLEDWYYINEVAINGTFGTMQERWDALDKALNEPGGGKRIQGYVDQLAAAGYSYEALGWTYDEVKQKEEELTKTFEQQTKELTDEEVKYTALYNIINFVKGAVDGLKTGIKGFLSGAGNIGRAIGESFLAISAGFREGFLSIDISSAFSKFTESFVNFTAALKPSESTMQAIREVTKKVSEGLGELIQKAILAGSAVASFAADILTGKTSLSELKGASDLSPVESFAAGFLNVISNLKNVVFNAFKSIGRIIKSFRTAFKNVFKSSGVTSLVSKFTDGISNMSDMFTISEDAADKLTSAFESIFKIIQKVGNSFTSVFSKISSFFGKKGLGSINGNTKELVKDIADMSDEVVDVSVNAEKAEGIFARLKIIFANFIDKVKQAPKNIKAFYEELKQSEGVQKLSESFKNLKTEIKNTINNVLPPVEASLSAFGAAAGEGGENAGNRIVNVASKIAEGISWIVDKITYFVGKIPEWMDSIDKFFTKIQAGVTITFDKFTTKADELGNKFGVDKLIETLSSEWNSITNEGQTVGEKVKLFACSLIENVVKALDTVNWDVVGKTGMLTLIGMNLYKFFGILSAGETFVTNVASIPKNIGSVFKSLGGIFDEVKKTVTKLSNVYVLLALVGALVSLMGAVAMLADIPAENLDNVISVMAQLAFVILMLSKAVELVTRNTQRTSPEKVQQSTFTLAQISGEISGLIGVALLIAAVGATFYIALQAVADVANMFQNSGLSADTVNEVVEIITSLLKAIGFMVIGMVAVVVIADMLEKMLTTEKHVEILGKKSKSTTKKATDGVSTLVGTFAGIALVMVGLAASLYILVQAVKIVSENDFKPEAMAFVFGMFVIILAIVAEAVKNSKDANTGPILAMAAVIAVIAGAMYLIVSQILILGAALALAQRTGNGEAMIVAISSVFIFIGVVLFAISSILKNAYLVPAESVKGLSGMMLALAGVVLVAAIAVGLMVKAWESVDDSKILSVIIGVVISVAAIIAIAVTIEKLTYQLNDFYSDKVFAALGGIALVVIAIGAAIWLMGNAFSSDPGAALAGALVGVVYFGIIAAALTLLCEQLQKSAVSTDAFITVVFGISAVMLVLAISTVIIAAAAVLMASSNFLAAVGTILLVGGLFAAAVVLIHMLSKLDISPKKMETIADTIVAIGAMMLMISISALVFAKACEAMASVDSGAFLKAISFIGVMMLIFAALAGALAAIAVLGGGKGKDNVAIIVTVLEGVGKAFVSIGIAMALMGASVLLLGIGIGVLAGGIGGLCEGIAVLAQTFKEHWVTVAILLTVLIAITVVLALLIKAAKPITTVANEAATGVGQAVGKVTGLFSKAIEGLKKLFKESPGKLKKWWDKFTPRAKIAIASGIVTIVGAIAAATPETLEHVKDMIVTVIKFIVSIIPKLVGGLFDILVTLLNSLADEIRKRSAEVAYAIWNVVEALLEVIIDVLSEGMQILFGASKGLFEKIGLGDWIDKAMSAQKLIANGAKASLRKGLNEARNYANTTESLTQTMSGLDAEMNRVTGNVAKQNGLVKDSNGNWVKATDAVNDYSDSLSDASKKSRSTKFLTKPWDNEDDESTFNVSDLVSNLKSGDTDISAITEKLGIGGGEGFLSGMGNVLGGDGMSIPGLDTDSMGNLLDNSGFDDMTIAGEGEEDAVAYDSAFAESIDTPNSREEVSAATDNLMGEVEDTIDKHKDQLSNEIIPMTMHEMYSAMVRYGANTPYGPGPIKAGEYLVQGIANAMINNKDLAAKSSEELAESVDENFIGPLKIESPSKVFYENGLNIIRGLQNGIDQNTTEATGAMTDLSTQMITSFGNPLEYAAKIASGEIQYDPTIRPVMDTSNIGRSAFDVNAMFRDQSISLSGLSGQIAYDMTNLNNSNAAVVSEIQALRQDMDYMTEELTNMQIVMDTGALVGSTVGAYDSALGQRQMFRERGN